MESFSPEQQEVIDQKIQLLLPLFEAGLGEEEFFLRAKSIESRLIQKRVLWFEENKKDLDYLSRTDLCDLQKAVGMLYGSYMKIFDGVRVIPLDDDMSDYPYAAHIISSNFCPYLEAMKQLKVEPEKSVWVCENVLEKPCEALVQKINPSIKFYRIYERIRPIAEVCLERLFWYAPDVEKWLEQLQQECMYTNPTT
jgi:hypothetical protein